MDWFLSLPPAEALVPCGGGTHPMRWQAGRLECLAHPDAEAERVLAALGGEKARCIQAAETWARHADDLDVLACGPRSVADAVTVDWDDEQHRASLFGLPPGLLPPAYRPRGGSRAYRGTPQQKLAGRLPEDFLRRVEARIEVLQLMALGPPFQFRFAGAVAAAWAAASRTDQRASRQPELTAALTGRAAPAVAGWTGVSPDSVIVTPMEPPAPSPRSWGSLDVLGTGANRLVRASLPVGWLATVWACGLALVAGHLVVAVEEPGWPRARVLALPAPGAAPVPLDVTGTDSGPIPRWQPITA
jgi:hypothetical protein